VMTKMHHATVDGVSGANLLGHLCSLEADAPPLASSSDPTRISAPNDVELVGRALLSLARRPLSLAKLLGPVAEVVPEWVRRAREGRAMPAPFTAPRTSFNGTITGHRSVAFGGFSLDDVKEVKKAVGGTVNDVVLAVCAGALRRYLQVRGELPDSPLIAMVPVSVHGRSDRDDGSNKVMGMFASLPTDVEDPLERLRRIAADNTHAKEHVNAIDADMLQDWARFAAPRTFGLAVRVYSGLRLPERHPPVYNLVVSNVPGPPVPLYFLGARIEALYPLGPVFHGVGLNVTVMSNENRLNVGLIACRELVSDDAIWTLSDAMPEAMTELLAAARGTAGGEASPRLSATQRSEVLQDAALRSATKQPAAKQPATKQSATKKSAAKKSPAKKTTAKKTAAKKATTRKSSPPRGQ
jgi:diacylglycerol O-acyltransferase